MFATMFFLTRNWNAIQVEGVKPSSVDSTSPPTDLKTNEDLPDILAEVLNNTNFRKDPTNFHIICLIWALLHPIFMVARVPIFLLYAIFTCCCDKGEVLDADFPYNLLFISFEYIDAHEALEEQGDELFANPW